LFHGWGFDSRIWDPVLPSLAERYEVYCVDLPGFGLSPFMEWEAFKSSVLSQLPERFALIGWSLGGLVATRLALEAPDQVTHLLQIASSPSFVEDVSWPGIAKATLLGFSERLMKDSDDVLREFVTLQLPGQEGNIQTLTTIQGLQSGLDWLITWDFRDRLSLLRCPVLYIFGSRDAIVTLKTMKVMQDKYPYFNYLLISKAAHALFLSHLDASVIAITDFII
jgi:pimeloyl-[acyl-carrier protein] methyl ester esterase